MPATVVSEEAEVDAPPTFSGEPVMVASVAEAVEL
jgi:hypothetical protein